MALLTISLRQILPGSHLVPGPKPLGTNLEHLRPVLCPYILLVNFWTISLFYSLLYLYPLAIVCFLLLIPLTTSPVQLWILLKTSFHCYQTPIHLKFGGKKALSFALTVTSTFLSPLLPPLQSILVEAARSLIQWAMNPRGELAFQHVVNVASGHSFPTLL